MPNEAGDTSGVDHSSFPIQAAINGSGEVDEDVPKVVQDKIDDGGTPPPTCLTHGVPRVRGGIGRRREGDCECEYEESEAEDAVDAERGVWSAGEVFGVGGCAWSLMQRQRKTKHATTRSTCGGAASAASRMLCRARGWGRRWVSVSTPARTVRRAREWEWARKAARRTCRPPSVFSSLANCLSAPFSASRRRAKYRLSKNAFDGERACAEWGEERVEEDERERRAGVGSDSDPNGNEREGEPDSHSKKDGEEGNDAGEEKGDEEDKGESTNKRKEKPEGSARRTHATTGGRSPQKRAQRAGKRAHRAARAAPPRRPRAPAPGEGERRAARREDAELELELEADELGLGEAVKMKTNELRNRRKNRKRTYSPLRASVGTGVRGGRVRTLAFPPELEDVTHHESLSVLPAPYRGSVRLSRAIRISIPVRALPPPPVDTSHWDACRSRSGCSGRKEGGRGGARVMYNSSSSHAASSSSSTCTAARLVTLRAWMLLQRMMHWACVACVGQARLREIERVGMGGPLLDDNLTRCRREGGGGGGGGLNYTRVVQMSEQRVYGRYTCGTVRVVILTEIHKIPTEHKPIPGGRSHKTLTDGGGRNGRLAIRWLCIVFARLFDFLSSTMRLILSARKSLAGPQWKPQGSRPDHQALSDKFGSCARKRVSVSARVPFTIHTSSSNAFPEDRGPSFNAAPDLDARHTPNSVPSMDAGKARIPQRNSTLKSASEMSLEEGEEIQPPSAIPNPIAHPAVSAPSYDAQGISFSWGDT
ncbi:hypothetical protein C8R44DRAFT_753769 [Mycena epipterygia]|nr:hypothetical protein C8R44DRAFT_753769 [Mycena epipterygia]